MTNELKNKIRKLYLGGATWRNIATVTGTSRSDVGKALAGLTGKRKPGRRRGAAWAPKQTGLVKAQAAVVSREVAKNSLMKTLRGAPLPPEGRSISQVMVELLSLLRSKRPDTVSMELDTTSGQVTFRNKTVETFSV